MKFISVTNFDFLKHRLTAFCLSGLLVLGTLGSLWIKKGPNFGIDFTGGTLLEVLFDQDVGIENIRKSLQDDGISSAEVQSVLGENRYIIRIKEGELVAQEASTRILSTFKNNFPQAETEILRSEFVGAVVGRLLIRKALFAIVCSLSGIIIFVAFRFKNVVWGISGVLALMHDVFLTLGLFSVMNLEVTLTVIAALLTIAGYSINDTIVVFDRIRENSLYRRKDSFAQIINRSLNETLRRTVITSLTTIFVVLSLFLFGGSVIHDFALALLFGVVVGTYSSLFIATPMVYVWYYRSGSNASR